MNNKIITLLFAGAAYFTWLSIGMAQVVEMPMRFISNADYIQGLKAYPLGKINKQMVLSHHGKEDKEITLPNGLQAWVYDLSFYNLPKKYILPNGKEKVVLERKAASRYQIYLLVFSDDEKVIDVIYRKSGKSYSALLLQLDLK